MFGLASQQDLQVMDKFFSEFLELVSNKRNKFTFNGKSGNTNVDRILSSWMEKVTNVESMMKDDMKVMGEVVLTMDKIEQGNFGCHIRSSSVNPMTATLVKTVNNMIGASSDNMVQLREALDSYTEDDFTQNISIDPRLGSDMLQVMSSVNVLGETLRTNAKLNLNNGETLNSNAVAMSDSMSNVASKANQQAASLEETAASVEEITSNIKSSSTNVAQMSILA
ncbi:MAG: hypothetical protein KAJ49_09990, partial [Arcobacteraceae bacterium]|nr:hypothetical protein [Arcobacteraceae bacterium]